MFSSAPVIADPVTGHAHVHERPQAGEYGDVRTYPFGAELVVTGPELRVETGLRPRER